MSEIRKRFKLLPYVKEAKKKKVLIVGAGGIGSWTALFLSRVGYKLMVIDFDIIAIKEIQKDTILC